MSKSKKPPLTLIVVPQETKLAKYLEAEGAVVVVEGMATGDVAMPNKSVGWEVKSTSDLIASFVTKKKGGIKYERLKEQMTRMLDVYKEPILCIWDWFTPTAAGYILTSSRISGVRWDSLWGALNYWQRRGIILDLAASREHAAHRIIMTCKSRS